MCAWENDYLREPRHLEYRRILLSFCCICIRERKSFADTWYPWLFKDLLFVQVIGSGVLDADARVEVLD